MNILLTRFKEDSESTIGFMSIDSEPIGFTLEDPYRKVKVPGETRIPAGTYEIKLRTEGGMHTRYSHKFDFHKGMLHLQHVYNFTHVYIHIGNTVKETEGCILVGKICGSPMYNSVGRSTDMYKELYKRIVEAMDNGERVTITIKEL